jgi:paired amphipathic helix protein Sin3a
VEEMDANMFEECMRCLYGPEAYIVFTIDRATQTLCKQIQAVATDDICNSLLQLYEDKKAAITLSEKKKKPVSGLRNQIAYRMSAEAVAGNEDRLYRIEYARLAVQLIFRWCLKRHARSSF